MNFSDESNIIGLACFYFYPNSGKQEEFENIQRKWIEISDLLLKLRYQTPAINDS